jgi:ribonuclease Z
MGGPSVFGGLAGSGTLVKYGSTDNDCGDIILQFDAGRATSLRLSELGVGVNQLNAVFITHLHSDHTVGLIDILQTRWHFFGKPLDLVCSSDKTTDKPSPRTLSCANFGEHIADAAIHAGEIAQRSTESKKRDSSGPGSIVNFIPVQTALATKAAPALPVQVWQSGKVTVSAIASRHIPGHLSYRVDTPKGSVVIGGDAGNDIAKPPRPNSTSAAVERLSQGADVLVHSTMHPVFGPDGGSSFPAPIFFRQSTAADLGALAKRAEVSHLMLTHLIPAIGAKSVGPYKVPGGPLREADYESSVQSSGYQGQLHVGKDKLTIRLPASN